MNMRDYEGAVFNSLIESLKSVESIARASIRQAETYMQRIEGLAKERKILRYYVSELSQATTHYSVAERSMDRLEALLQSILAMTARLNNREKAVLIQRIKCVVKEARSNTIQFKQEENIIEEMEKFILKIELNKIKRVRPSDVFCSQLADAKKGKKITKREFLKAFKKLKKK